MAQCLVGSLLVVMLLRDPVLAPVFNLFIKGLVEEVESLPSKCADHKTWRTSQYPECWAAIKKNFNSMERGTEWNSEMQQRPVWHPASGKE